MISPNLTVKKVLPAAALCLALISPVQVWSQEYGLPDLIQLAVNNHPQVRSGQAAEQSARKAIEAIEWQLYPTPAIIVEGVKASATDPNYKGDDKVTTLRLSQPLYNGGSQTAQMDKAKAALKIAQANVRETSLQIAQKVVQHYTDWLGAELKVRTWKKSQAIHQKLLQSAKNRIAQGVSAPSDFILVQGRLDATNAELFSATLQAELALNRLREQLDIPLTSAQINPTAASPLSSFTTLDKLLEEAERTSPAIEKAQSQVLVARANALERQSALLPDVSVRVERQIGNFAIANAATENRIFLTLSTKLGPGLSSFSQVSAARALEESAQIDIQTQRRIIREMVVNDHAMDKSYTERLQMLLRSLEASQAVLDSFERQFASGRKSWLDLMTIAKEVAQNEAQIAELKAAQLQTAWRLHINTSGTYFPKRAQP